MVESPTSIRTPPWEKRGKESRESDRRVELGHDVCSPFFSLFLLLVLFLSISSLFLPSFFFLLLLIQAAAASKKRGGRSLGSKASGGLNPPAFRTCSKHPLLLFPHTRSTTVQAPAAHPSPHLLPPSLSPPLPSRREDDILGRRTGGKKVVSRCCHYCLPPPSTMPASKKGGEWILILGRVAGGGGDAQCLLSFFPGRERRNGGEIGVGGERKVRE